MNRPRGGFTLVETLIALMLSTLVIVLVSSTFLAQNRYQAHQVVLADVHDNARAATDLVARELRSSMRGGIVVAGNQTLTVRSPVAVASVCARSGFFGTTVDVHFDGGLAQLSTDDIAGAAIYTESSESWDYAPASWAFLNGGSFGTAARCAANGANTTDAVGEFHSIRRLFLLFGFSQIPEVGELVMFYRETTFTIGPSALDPSGLALFRQVNGGTAVEFASGIDTTSEFRYRLGPGSYQDAVAVGSLHLIDGVQLTMAARRRSEAVPDRDVSFGLTTTLLLGNVP